MAFLHYGKNYQGAIDSYIYFYGRKSGDQENIYMGRAKNDLDSNGVEFLKHKNNYEYFTGLDSNDNPKAWTSNFANAKPVFTDTNTPSYSSPSASYNAELNRFFITISRSKARNFGVFDAPKPWGPWTTAYYSSDWIDAGGGYALKNDFVNKWTENNGLTNWLMFSCHSGDGKNGSCTYHDSIGIVKATFELHSDTNPTPKAPLNLRQK
jgi:hypothetical protein